jgi:glycosyltransferase involved in cell wall biosynthesis
MKKRILFITPFLDYTGSRIFMWRFLKRFDRTMLEAAIYSHHYGELIKDMPSDIKTYFFHTKNESKYLYSFRRLWNRRNGKSPYFNKLMSIIKSYRPEIVVCNTVGLGYVTDAAVNMHVKIVTIVHELPVGFTVSSYAELKKAIELSDVILGSSTIVCEELKRIGRSDIKVQPGFIDLNEIQIKRDREEMRLSLGIKPNEFVWVTSGTLSGLKGADLFLNLASNPHLENVKFLWVGGMPDTGYSYYAEKIISMHLHDKVIITGYKKYDEYYDYLNLGDGFLMPSYFESFSLTTLEALTVGLPVICYNCGGIVDFVNERNGIILDNRNTDSWIKAMSKIMNRELIFDKKVIKGSVIHLTSETQVRKMQENILSIL